MLKKTFLGGYQACVKDPLAAALRLLREAPSHSGAGGRGGPADPRDFERAQLLNQHKEAKPDANV